MKTAEVFSNVEKLLGNWKIARKLKKSEEITKHRGNCKTPRKSQNSCEIRKNSVQTHFRVIWTFSPWTMQWKSYQTPLIQQNATHQHHFNYNFGLFHNFRTQLVNNSDRVQFQSNVYNPAAIELWLSQLWAQMFRSQQIRTSSVWQYEQNTLSMFIAFIIFISCVRQMLKCNWFEFIHPSFHLYRQQPIFTCFFRSFGRLMDKKGKYKLIIIMWAMIKQSVARVIKKYRKSNKWTKQKKKKT